MVDRQLGDTLDTPGAIVVDFDGTVIAGNSLRWILRLGLKHLLRRLRLPSAIIVATLMLMRKLRLVSHETMKYGSLRVIGDDPALGILFWSPQQPQRAMCIIFAGLWGLATM